MKGEIRGRNYSGDERSLSKRVRKRKGKRNIEDERNKEVHMSEARRGGETGEMMVKKRALERKWKEGKRRDTGTTGRKRKASIS